MAFAITTLALDQPGLTHKFGQVIKKHNGNIATSRMVTLGEVFVISALVDFPDQSETLTTQLTQALEQQGFEVLLKATLKQKQTGQAVQYYLHAISLDHPGIVEQLAACVRAEQGSFLHVQTELVHAPWSGTPTFELRGQILLPSTAHARNLAKRLDVVAEEDNIDIRFEPYRHG